MSGGTVATQMVGGCGTGSFFTIAISHNTIYYMPPFGGLEMATISGGATPVVSDCTFVSGLVAGNALTISKAGILYYANGSSLYSIDPKNPTPVYLGNMSYSSGGDLIFYKDELYMASPSGIVKVSLTNPSASTMYIPIPNKSIFGLASIQVNGQLKVYALATDAYGTQLLELDMDKQLVKGVAGSLPFTAGDAGSNAETGVVSVIKVDSVTVSHDCAAYQKGQAIVVCEPTSSQYTFTLNTGASNNTGVFNGLAPGSYVVNITSDGGEAPVHTAFVVPDYTGSGPVITPELVNPVCDIKGHIRLDAGADDASLSVEYNGQYFGFDHVFDNLGPGTYHFTILTNQGCVLMQKDYTLQQETCPPITVTDIQVAAECSAYGQASVTVSTKPHPDKYVYTLNGTSDTTGVFDFLLPGTYNLEIVSSGGDDKKAQVTVPDFTLGDQGITYQSRNAVCSLLGQVQFFSSNPAVQAVKVKYGTETYNFSQPITGLPPGENHFIIYDRNGCILTERDINIGHDKCTPLSFPNTFTPNGDGVNDIFRVNQDSNPLTFKLMVYTRWGMLLFQSGSNNNGWDGTFNGKAVPAGVYYWVADYTMPDGKPGRQSGYVTLIR